MSESDVQQLIAEVAESFGGGIDTLLAHYADPVVIAGPDSTQTLDHGVASGMFEQMRSQLREQGFDRTQIRSLNVSMLGADVALADATLDRRRSDGSLLETIHAGYLCRRREGRWLIVALAPYAPPTEQTTNE